MNAPEPLMRAENVESGYGSLAIVAPTSFTLAPGEALAICGPNGSGKSTLLRTLIGRQTALSGLTYFADGLLDESRATVRRALASVFDEDAYFPELTVREHLEMVAAAHGLTEQDTVDRELEFFDLVPLAHRFPEVLSSGQRRRFLLSAAFLRPFGLLVLDEPEQRLDLTMRARLTERLASLRAEVSPAISAQPPALMFVTHDPHLLTSVATRALYLENAAPGSAMSSSKAVPMTPREAAERLNRERG